MDTQFSIAHYRITSKLGEGGMGAVYRATDTKLNREVAIKVLPDALANDADYLARFQREAQVLASLNHPNIAIIHGIEQNALIMELVPGATLEERIAAGPIPIEEAAGICRQIAEALEAAHEKGIVHRDLKPANVKVTPEGVVKVLDFGLAKAAGPAAQSSTANSPTLTIRSTQLGVILGTAAYMAPEQAAGKPVDRRADIWSFGVVLYEMLSGGRLFDGETVAHTLADVLRSEIDYRKVPPDTPAPIRELVIRCLDRNVKTRLRDIGEARIALQKYLADPSAAIAVSAPPPRRASSALPWALAAAMAIVSIALGSLFWRATRPLDRPMMRFSVDLGPDAVRGSYHTTAISPDGTRLAYSSKTPAGSLLLTTRRLDQAGASVLAGTEGAQMPFFSPDSQWIGFTAGRKLKKISVNGGAALPLSEGVNSPRGGTWSEDGSVIATLDSLHLFRFPAGGGEPRMLSRPEDHGERVWRWPQVLSGGQTVLFTGNAVLPMGLPTTGFENANIEVLSLRTNQVKTLHRGGYYGRYLPTGHLIYVHQGTLFAVPFDRDRLEVRGVPIPVLDDVAGSATSGLGHLDFSETGTLVYQSGKTADYIAPMVWLDSAGKAEQLYSPSVMSLTPKVSPDGRFVAFSSSGGDILVYDSLRATTARLTSNPAGNSYPLWMPDGKHIIFGGVGNADDALWWVRADGSSQPLKLLPVKDAVWPTSISADGRRLAFATFHSSRTASDIFTLSLDVTDPDHPKAGPPEMFLSEPGGQSDAAFSPDGRWLAYAAFEAAGSPTGTVYVRRFPGGSGGKWLISNAGGRFPIWSPNGRELFYQTSDGHIMVVSYTAKGDSFNAGKPQLWSPTAIFTMGINVNYDLAPDGKRFVVFPVEGDRQEKGNVHVTVLLNFFDELRRRVK